MLKAWILSIALVAALAACSNGEPLAACKGPVFQLNSGYWTPAPVVAGGEAPAQAGPTSSLVAGETAP